MEIVGLTLIFSGPHMDAYPENTLAKEVMVQAGYSYNHDDKGKLFFPFMADGAGTVACRMLMEDYGMTVRATTVKGDE